MIFFIIYFVCLKYLLLVRQCARTHCCTTNENMSWKHEIVFSTHVFNCLQTYVYGQTGVCEFMDLTEMGCGHTALCRTSTPNWNSRLHIGFVYGLCNTTRFGFTDCHCVLQLLTKSQRAIDVEHLHMYLCLV